MAVKKLIEYVSEAELKAEIIRVAKKENYRVYCNYDSRKSGPDDGFPDIIIVRPRILLAIEVKSEKGKVEDNQKGWRDAFNDVDYVAGLVIRPSNWERVKCFIETAPDTDVGRRTPQEPAEEIGGNIAAAARTLVDAIAKELIKIKKEIVNE